MVSDLSPRGDICKGGDMMREFIDIENAVFIAVCAVQDIADEYDICFDEDLLRDQLRAEMYSYRVMDENEF